MTLPARFWGRSADCEAWPQNPVGVPLGGCGSWPGIRNRPNTVNMAGRRNPVGVPLGGCGSWPGIRPLQAAGSFTSPLPLGPPPTSVLCNCRAQGFGHRVIRTTRVGRGSVPSVGGGGVGGAGVPAVGVGRDVRLRRPSLCLRACIADGSHPIGRIAPVREELHVIRWG